MLKPGLRADQLNSNPIDGTQMSPSLLPASKLQGRSAGDRARCSRAILRNKELPLGPSPTLSCLDHTMETRKPYY